MEPIERAARLLTREQPWARGVNQPAMKNGAEAMFWLKQSQEKWKGHLMFTKILSIVRFTFVIALILSAGSAQAQDLVSARVLSIEGQVEIRRQSSDQPQIQKIAFKIADELKAGDTIVTGKSGRLVLGLSDGSQAVIAPKTTVVIQDLSQSPRTLFNVIRGKTRVHIEKLGGQPNPYRVNTPTAVIAVRGTIFDVLVDDDETQVFLHEGQVEVTNLTAPNQPILLFAGQMTKVFLQRLPATPGSFKPGRNDGTFKTRRENKAPQDNRRVATGDSRPSSDRGAAPANSGARPDFDRGGSSPQGRASSDSGRSGSPSSGGTRPDFGRGNPSPNGPRPNSGPRADGKRP
jgi:hypothetical protein